MSLPVDYYSVLDISRDATDLQIKQAYRRLALQWHPMKNADKDTPIVTARFNALSEAYEVLTNPQSRAIYDIHGERGLKAGGIRTDSGEVTSPYTFKTDPSILFDSVFGTLSPYAAFFAYEGKDQQKTKTGEQVNGIPAATVKNDKVEKPSAQEINLYVSLEEVYRGCTKKVKVTRKRFPSTSATTSVLDDRYLTVSVQPGWQQTTRITYSGEGDQLISSQQPYGDITFILTDKPHPLYNRSLNNDLHYYHSLSLVEALCGSILKLKTLDDRYITIALNDICTPAGTKVIVGEGMPIAQKKTGPVSSPPQKGNLIIHFEITFPDQLTLEQKEGIRRILA